jgi:L-serine dehydratase
MPIKRFVELSATKLSNLPAFMKNNTLPSILNDVIGPVMRGPSSSHTAASWRIARTGLQLLNEPLDKALIELDKKSVWASNYREQGTAMGMDGGLLGMDMTDERIIRPELVAKAMNVSIAYKISSFETDHPNTVRLTLSGRKGKKVELMAVSTGGGMFKIRRYNGFAIDIMGDYYVMFIIVREGEQNNILKTVNSMNSSKDPMGWTIQANENLIQVKSSTAFPEHIRNSISKLPGVLEALCVDPVLPVISGNETGFPFTDLGSMLTFAKAKKYSLGQAGIAYECSRSGLAEAEVKDKMRELIRIIELAISKGLKGTVYQDRILHQQARLIDKAAHEGKIKTGPLINRMIAYITALMEAKSAMEVIVAIPTAGSCGTFGGTIKAFCETHKLDEEQKIMSYFAGGLIGVFFAMGPGFSAEEHGCQVETGAAGCMAAAALVELSGGSAQEAVDASSMALQNCIGLVCDPVADRVEVPCLGKNVTAGMNALSASSMALSGFDAVIPLDQVIKTAERVGRSLPSALCNTGQGGLAVTPTARKIKALLNK